MDSKQYFKRLSLKPNNLLKVKLILTIFIFQLFGSFVLGYEEFTIENLNKRGLVAINKKGAIHLSWRALNSDNSNSAYKIKRGDSRDNLDYLKDNFDNEILCSYTNFDDENVIQNRVYYYCIEDMNQNESNIIEIIYTGDNIADNSIINPVLTFDIDIAYNGRFIDRIAIGDLDDDNMFEYAVITPHSSTSIMKRIQIYDHDGGNTFKSEIDLNFNASITNCDDQYPVAMCLWDVNPKLGGKRAELICRVLEDDKGTSNSSDDDWTLKVYSFDNGLSNPDDICTIPCPDWHHPSKSSNENRCLMAIAYLEGISLNPYLILQLGCYEFNVGVYAYKFNDDGTLNAEPDFQVQGVIADPVNTNEPLFNAFGGHAITIFDQDENTDDEIFVGPNILDMGSGGLFNYKKCFDTNIGLSGTIKHTDAIEIIHKNLGNFSGSEYKVYYHAEEYYEGDPQNVPGVYMYRLNNIFTEVGSHTDVYDPNGPGAFGYFHSDKPEQEIFFDGKEYDVFICEHGINCPDGENCPDATIQTLTHKYFLDLEDELPKMEVTGSNDDIARGEDIVWNDINFTHRITKETSGYWICKWFRKSDTKIAALSVGDEPDYKFTCDFMGDFREEVIVVSGKKVMVFSNPEPCTTSYVSPLYDLFYRQRIQCSGNSGRQKPRVMYINQNLDQITPPDPPTNITITIPLNEYYMFDLGFTKSDNLNDYKLYYSYEDVTDSPDQQFSFSGELTINLDALDREQWLQSEDPSFTSDPPITLDNFDALQFLNKTVDGNEVTLRFSTPCFPASYADFCFEMTALKNGIESEKTDTACGRVDPPPYVDAGPDQIIQSAGSYSTTLTGEACTFDNAGTKIPIPNVQWDKESGPGNVTFSNPSTAITDVTFSESGLYVLSLDDLDSYSYVKDYISIMVYHDSIFTDWTPLFENTFSTLDANDWVIPESYLWSMEQDSGKEALVINTTHYYQKSGGFPGAVALFDSVFFDSYKLTFSARSRETEINWWTDYVLLFNYRNPNNYHYMIFNKTSVILYRVTFGEKTKLISQKRYPIQDNAFHDIELIHHNQYTSVKLGEKVVLLLDDPELTRGQFGFGSMDDAASFADIHVEADSSKLPPFTPYAVEEGFNDNTAIGWSPLTPTRWTVQEIEESPAYSMTANSGFPVGFGDRYGSYGPLNEYSLVSDKSFTDFQFNCKAKIDLPEGESIGWWSDLAVVFGYQNPSNYYYFEFTREWQASALIKVVDDTAHFIARPGIGVIQDDAYHYIGIIRDDATIKVSIDFKELVCIEDTTFMTGQIGVGTYNDPCSFDNILVDAIGYSEPDPTPQVFFDNFEENGTKNWCFLNEERWALTEITSGDTALSIITEDYPHPGSGKAGEYGLIDSLVFEDFTFQCKAKLSSVDPQTSCDDYGFIFGYVNENNYYYMDFVYNNDGATKLYKVEGDTSILIKTADYCYLRDNGYHEIKITRDGPAICVKSGGQTVLFVYDESFMQGQIGLATTGSLVNFDNVTVYADTVYSTTPAGMVFEDHFDDGDSEGWTAKNSSRWSITTSDGNNAYSINTSDYSAQYPTSNHVGEYSMIDSLEYTDFSFECRAKSDEPMASTYCADFVVMFGKTAWDSYYWMNFNNRVHACRLCKSINGTITELASSENVLLTDNVYHDIKITRLGDMIRVFFDGIKVIQVTESDLITGQIGVGSHNDKATFDDIYVTDQVSLPDPAEEFFDDFENTEDTWTPKNSNRWSRQEDYADQNNTVYSIITEGYTIQYPWPSAIAEYSTIDDRVYTDFALSCDVRSDAGNMGAWDVDYVILFAKSAWNHYYWMKFSNRIQCCKLLQQNGCTSPIEITASPQVLVTDNEFHHVEIIRMGDSLHVYFDSQKVASAEITEEITGQIGIGSHSDKVSFDNVHISTIDLAKRLHTLKTQQIPKTYALSQNYPNPFNPTTTINYQLPEASEVKLFIYNIMGQKVVTLVDQDKEPGYHEILWDGLNQFNQKVASGIYMYCIEAIGKGGKRFKKVKKMLLLK
jgi:hypothetical protein